MSDESTRLAVIEERLRGTAEALRLQALEYERRLEDLNGAHEKAIAVQHTYVTREMFDQQAKETERTRAALVESNDARHLAMRTEYDERFGRVESFQAKLLGAFGLGTIVLPTIVYLLNR